MYSQLNIDIFKVMENHFPEELRYDSGTLSSYERMADGTIRCHVAVSKVGPLSYRRADGSTEIEQVIPQELYKRSSLNTLILQTVTNGHPIDMLTDLKSRKDAEIGKTGQVGTPEYPFLVFPAVISEAKAVKMIEDAMSNDEDIEVSAGYYANVMPAAQYKQFAKENNIPFVMEFGNGEKFDLADVPDEDLIQVNRRYDHLAALRPGVKGRAGSQVKLRLDAMLDPLDHHEVRTMTVQKEETQLLELGGISVRVDSAPGLIELLEKVKKMDELSAELVETKALLTKANSRLDENETVCISEEEAMDAAAKELCMDMDKFKSMDMAGKKAMIDAAKAAKMCSMDEAIKELTEKLDSTSAKLAVYEEKEHQAKLDSFVEILQRQIAVAQLKEDAANALIEQAKADSRSVRSISELIIAASGDETSYTDASDSEVYAVANYVAKKLPQEEAKAKQVVEQPKVDAADQEPEKPKYVNFLSELLAKAKVDTRDDANFKPERILTPLERIAAHAEK